MSELAALEVEHDALLSFLYMCPVGVVRAGADGTVEMINPQAAQLLFPLTRTPALENLFDALESCAPELREMATRFPAPSGSICQQHRIVVSRSGPGPRVLACTLLKISPDCLMAVLDDVTQQVEQERKLRQNEAMFAALVAGVHDFALFSLDSDGRIDGWNASGREQTGFADAEVIGRDIGVLFAAGDETSGNIHDLVQDATREGWSLREHWCARRDGSRYWCQIMVAADREGIMSADEAAPKSANRERYQILGFAVVLRDITERHVTGDDLRLLLTTDYLTTATNRSRFFDLAEIEVTRCRANGRPLSVIMLDLDNFKHVNDCFGHASGDLVLKRLVTLCRQQLRGRDVLARMGGEEFAILLPGADLVEAVSIAERIRSAVAADAALPASDCLGGEAMPPASVTVSLGCATLTGALDGIDALLKSADGALYEAKRGGRNRVCPTAQHAPPPAHADRHAP